MLTFLSFFLILSTVNVYEKVEAESSLYDDFMYKLLTVGVIISPDTMGSIPGISSQEYNFRDVIYTALAAEVQLGNSTEDQVSNITIVPLDSETDFDNITDISMLISIAGCAETSELNAKITALYGTIAHIAITEPGCARLDPATALTIPLTQFRKTDEVRQLIVDMRQANVLPKWKSVVVIYDEIMGEERLKAVMDALRPDDLFPDIATALFTVDSRSNAKSYERQMEEVFQNFQGKKGQFLLVTTLANMESTLSLAKRMGMLGFTTQWLFLAPDGVLNSDQRWNYVTERIITDGVNVGFITNKTVGVGSYDQLLCNVEQIIYAFTRTIEDLAQQEYNLYLQVSDEEWENRKVTREFRVASIVSNATVDIDELIQEACQNFYRPSWKIEATENGRYGKRVFDVGNWFNFQGLKMTDDLFPHVIGGFRGRKLKITSFHYPPWQIFTTNETSGETTYSGLVFEIVNQMGSVLNFTYEVIVPTDGATWGAEKFDGTWNGMMRLVIDQKVVLGAAAFANRPERSRHVNFTMTIEREAYTFMVNRPSELSRVLLFAEPFSNEVWVCIAASLILIAPTFYLIHRHSPYYAYNNKRTDHGLFLFKNCFQYVYGALLQQGGSLLPDAISGRMLIGFWWLFALVTVTTYSGNLVAFLTFPRIEAPVNSINDIVRHKGVSSWGFLKGSVIEGYLKDSNNSDLTRLYRFAKRHPAMNETLLKQVRRGNHAYIDWKISLMLIMKKEFLKTEKCEYMLGKEEIFEEQIALIVPRTSPYLMMFNNEINWMLQSGLVKMWKVDYWPKKDRCSSTVAVAAVNRTVKIGDMQGSFYLLMLGFFFAFIAMAVEFFVFRRKQGKMIDQIKVFVTSNKAAEFLHKKDLPFLH